MDEHNGAQFYLPLLKQLACNSISCALLTANHRESFTPLAIVGRFLATPLLYDSRIFRQAYYVISVSTR
jgi:hypothetical protein